MLKGLSFVQPKLKTFLHNRKNTNVPTEGKVDYWFHCASLGEYEMAIPLIEKVLETTSLDKILVTFFSPSGLCQAAEGTYASRIMYLPLDSMSLVRQFYDSFEPKVAFLVRYDLWYNLLYHGLENDVNFYLINGRFKKDHFVFSWYGKPYLNLLSKFSKIFVSDKNSQTNLTSSNLTNIEFTGDTRFDRVAQIASRAKEYKALKDFKGERKLLLLGSSWDAEEKVLLEFLQEENQDLCFVIAPHDLSRVATIQSVFNEFKPKLYTASEITSDDKILILDTMGMLSSMYRYADFALIGGGFSGALHNIVEPAVWGCHISFGPKIEKFPEAHDFIQAGFAHKINNVQTWISTLKNLTTDDALLATVKENASLYVNEQTGATNYIWSTIRE